MQFEFFLQFDMLQLKYRHTHKQYQYIHVRETVYNFFFRQEEFLKVISMCIIRERS